MPSPLPWFPNRSDTDGTTPPGWGSADIDGDGRSDIISLGTDANVHGYWNVTGKRGFPYPFGPATIGIDWPDPARVRFADIDGDRRDEIIWIGSDGIVKAWRNIGGYPTVFPYPGTGTVIGNSYSNPNS